MPEPFFITTAIDYTNGAPHIGHAYEKVLADVVARYRRLRREDVFFLTGVDQHGQKVQQSAESAGIPPQEFVDAVTEKFLALWTKLDVRYDRWAATTDLVHKECVRKILSRLNAAGQIYKARRSGYYSVRQEQFLTDKERGPDGGFGPEWGEVEFREEENYYFKLAEHRQWLLDLIDKRSAQGKPLVLPDFRVAELRNAVEKLEGDLCISRPKARLSWGIEFPFDPEFVTYVWFDALVNYISFAPGYDPEALAPDPSFSRLWHTVVHVIGKDILIPAHGVYWPVMLKALGFTDDEMPTLLVHGWWNIAGTKMSKSLGNIVDPNALADKYGAGALRYYLMSDIATGRDSDFSEERLIQQFNTDLANNLGNLLNRSLNMTAKYRGGKLTAASLDAGLIAPDGVTGALRGYREKMDGFRVNAALADALSIAVQCNAMIDVQKPWALAKDPARGKDLDAVLYTLAESLRITAILISPVLPRAAHGIFDQLAWKPDSAGSDSRFALDDTNWGGLPDGHVLGAPVPLFPRIDVSE
jgi:methionyl-tRNA synthetase